MITFSKSEVIIVNRLHLSALTTYDNNNFFDIKESKSRSRACF